MKRSRPPAQSGVDRLQFVNVRRNICLFDNSYCKRCFCFAPTAICDDLTNPAFGTVTVSGQTVSSTATYQCNSGYRLVGTDTRLCEGITPTSAEWSGQAPICQRTT